MKFINSHQISRFSLFLTLGIFFFPIIPEIAAQVRCELVADSCLDLSQVTNPSITVPSNTTRIDKNGLDICIPLLTNTSAVDLVFVVDQSGSMEGNDEDFQTPLATTAALNLIVSISPNSNVGFVGFANGICDGTQGSSGAGQKFWIKTDTRVPPAALTTPGHKELLLEQTTYDADNYLLGCGNLGRGTNYYRAFLLAEKWLSQMDTPNRKIIIFLTDGEPNREEAEFNTLVNSADSTNFPIVHAIFVDGSDANLNRLVNKTGGIYSQIGDFTRLEGVMNKMVGASLIPDAPENTLIKKNGSPVSATANHTHINLSQFQVNMNNDLALDLGSNQITVSSTTSILGLKENSVNIEVSGVAETTPGTKKLGENNMFDVVCYEASTLTATDQPYTNTIRQLSAYYVSEFGIVLKTPADDITAVAGVQGAGDTENIPLGASSSDYRSPAAFSHNAIKTPNNGIIDGLAGDTLLLSWVHPHDPRDTASTLLAIVDDRADTTEIIFTDLVGNEISSINDLAGNQFKVVVIDNKATGPLSVQLTSFHVDALTVTVQPTAPQRFEAVVAFGFSRSVNPANEVIEGVFDSTSATNQTTVTAKVKKVTNALLLHKIYVPVEKTWIIDQNGDGRADRIFIQYTEKLHGLPASVSQIHWPDGATEAKSASAGTVTPAINSLSFFNNDSSLVFIDLSQDPFMFGATSASAVNPPTLMLPDGIQAAIQDSVKPVLIAAEKRPSDFKLYMRANDSTIQSYPDTLVIILSEAITPVPNAVEPWKTLLLVEKGSLLLPIDILKEPVTVSPDGRILTVVIKNKSGSNTVIVGDTISLNPNAPYFDGKNNPMSALKTQITGRNGTKALLLTAWRGGPVSGDQVYLTSFALSTEIPVIEESTGVILGYMSTSTVEEWVPPLGINPVTGDIDINVQTDSMCKDGKSSQLKFPTECLSSRMVLTSASSGPYIAYISIYDNHGKFIRSLKQAFGYCGELENLARTTESGLKMNDLVWNMKDTKGDMVGNGVYIWSIKIRFENGDKRDELYKMGVARKDDILYKTCINGL